MQKLNELGQILTFGTYDILLDEVIKMFSEKNTNHYET